MTSLIKILGKDATNPVELQYWFSQKKQSVIKWILGKTTVANKQITEKMKFPFAAYSR